MGGRAKRKKIKAVEKFLADWNWQWSMVSSGHFRHRRPHDFVADVNFPCHLRCRLFEALFTDRRRDDLVYYDEDQFIERVRLGGTAPDVYDPTYESWWPRELRHLGMRLCIEQWTLVDRILAQYGIDKKHR